MSNSLQPHGLQSPWNSPGQNTAEGSLSLLQWIFPTQGLNSGLPHYRRILYQLSHKGSPGILEWVAYPFSSGSFQPRNWTQVPCIAGGFFTNWAIREALGGQQLYKNGSAQALFQFCTCVDLYFIYLGCLLRSEIARLKEIDHVRVWGLYYKFTHVNFFLRSIPTCSERDGPMLSSSPGA